MSRRDTAKSNLVYYIKEAWTSAGQAWDSYENQPEVEEIVDAIIDAAVEKCIKTAGEQCLASRGNTEKASDPRVRVKTMPEVRQKGWDDAVQAAVRVCDEFLEGDGYKEAKVTVKLLRERIRELGGE